MFGHRVLVRPKHEGCVSTWMGSLTFLWVDPKNTHTTTFSHPPVGHAFPQANAWLSQAPEARDTLFILPILWCTCTAAPPVHVRAQEKQAGWGRYFRGRGQGVRVSSNTGRASRAAGLKKQGLVLVGLCCTPSAPCPPPNFARLRYMLFVVPPSPVLCILSLDGIVDARTPI